MKNQLQETLTTSLAALKLALPELAIEKLLQYIQLLKKWNQAFNLTAIREPARMITHHLLDSLAVVPYIKGPQILDVGTGAGLPGIPLALALPNYQFVLLDSQGKKVRFLTQAIADLGLNNVKAVQARVETYTSESCFDTIITRAVGAIADMILATQHLHCAQGQWLFMKGLYPTAELAEITSMKKIADLQLKIAIMPLQVPGVAEERHLVCLT